MNFVGVILVEYLCLKFFVVVSIVIEYLCQVGELIGGSQREERLEYLETRLDDLKLDKDTYWWYLDLRRYGSGQEFFCLKLRNSLYVGNFLY